MAHLRLVASNAISQAEYQALIARADSQVDSELEALLSVQIRQMGLPLPEPNYYWAKSIGRQWRSEFAYTWLNLLIEIEGGTESHGKQVTVIKDGKPKMITLRSRHVTPGGFADDCVKYNAAQLLGWIVLRYTGKQVRSGEAISHLAGAITIQRGRMAHIRELALHSPKVVAFGGRA